MAKPSLIWSDVEVKGGTLTVQLRPLPTEGDWHTAFEVAVAALSDDIDAGDWGDVKLDRSEIVVTDVAHDPSVVEPLRRLLESLVQETEAEMGHRRAADAQRHQVRVEELRAQAERDRQMTEWFRAGPEG
jgi:hypothetical protein